MSYSPTLASSITNTKMKSPQHVVEYSGMCAVCTSNCFGSCEIGLSALRGSEAIYPFATDKNQFASEKKYPLDFSHFNINGRVFGTMGCSENAEIATYTNISIETTFGMTNKIKLKAPIILPAMAKLNWRDYYKGAALAGVLVVIGEDVITKDKGLILKEGKVADSPLIAEMLSSFNEYYNGYGEIILQANYDDEHMGVLDYAISKLGVKSVELKFGQAAKGIQGVGLVSDINEALRFQSMGYLIYPDPSDLLIASNYSKGIGQVFHRIGKLPIWDEDILTKRVAVLRALGVERICFKMGPYDPKDLIQVLKIASNLSIDLVTFDGGGGGTGNSPTKMMNEWGMPTVYLENILYTTLKCMSEKEYKLPEIAITGGFVMEDQVFKGLALGAPYINLIGIGRGAMAAAMAGKKVGYLIKAGKVPNEYKRFGETKESIFSVLRELKSQHGEAANTFSTGAIGLYSYLDRVSTGLKQLMALNRKFTLSLIDRSDLVPMTDLAEKVTGLETYSSILNKALNSL